MKTFIVGVIVGLSLAAAGVWAQNWQSFEGTVFQDAARNQEFKHDLEMQGLRNQFNSDLQRLEESRRRNPC